MVKVDNDRSRESSFFYFIPQDYKISISIVYNFLLGGTGVLNQGPLYGATFPDL